MKNEKLKHLLNDPLGQTNTNSHHHTFPLIDYIMNCKQVLLNVRFKYANKALLNLKWHHLHAFLAQTSDHSIFFFNFDLSNELCHKSKRRIQ